MGVPVSPRPHRHLLLSALVTAIPVVGTLLYPGPSGVSSACVEGLMFSQVLPECGLCLALPCSLPNHQGSVARYTSSDSVHESASLLNFWLLCQSVVACPSWNHGLRPAAVALPICLPLRSPLCLTSQGSGVLLLHCKGGRPAWLVQLGALGGVAPG